MIVDVGFARRFPLLHMLLLLPPVFGLPPPAGLQTSHLPGHFAILPSAAAAAVVAACITTVCLKVPTYSVAWLRWIGHA